MWRMGAPFIIGQAATCLAAAAPLLSPYVSPERGTTLIQRWKSTHSDSPGGGAAGGAAAGMRTASARARSRIAAGTPGAWKR